MDKEIGTYEYEWWSVFIGFAFLLLISISLVGTWYHFINKAQGIFKFHNLGFFLKLFVPGLMGILFSIFGLAKLSTMPKSILFKQNSIIIFYAISGNKVLSYEDISRLVIYQNTNWTEERKWRFSSAVLYYSENTYKVRFHPYRIFNFHLILENIQNKGLGHVITRKEIKIAA
jgi:hypothetical protein